LPQARRFTDLGVTADAQLPLLDPIDALARVPAGELARSADNPGEAESGHARGS
jgi:hypothetical protein